LPPERLPHRIHPPPLARQDRHAGPQALLPAPHPAHVPLVLRRAHDARAGPAAHGDAAEAPAARVYVPDELRSPPSARDHHVLGLVALARRAVLPDRTLALLLAAPAQDRSRAARAPLGARARRARRQALHLFPLAAVERLHPLRRGLFPHAHALR